MYTCFDMIPLKSMPPPLFFTLCVASFSYPWSCLYVFRECDSRWSRAAGGQACGMILMRVIRWTQWRGRRVMLLLLQVKEPDHSFCAPIDQIFSVVGGKKVVLRLGKDCLQ